MKLIVIELKSELAQTIIPDRTEHVEGIRLHLYKHAEPTGYIHLELRDENNSLITQSEVIPISSIESDGYYHGQIRFNVNAHLKEQTEYKIVLCHTGYIFDESAYVGWCLDYDYNSYPKGYEYSSPLKSSFDFEIWTRK